MGVSRRLTLAMKVTAVLLMLFAAVSAGMGFYLYRLSLTLPDVAAGSDSLDIARTSFVYAADGSVIAQWHADENRTVVPLSSVAQVMRDAVVVIEDERFYEHRGVDTQVILSALRLGAAQDTSLRAGSTITQQLVRMIFPDEERTIIRKVKEVMLAYELDVRADKDDVLEVYLNTVYFGQGAFGVEAAARQYFSVGASELSLPQAAMLAGLIDAPGRYSPINEPEAALERRNRILSRMHELGYISAQALRGATGTEMALTPPAMASSVAPYFVEYVRQYLIDKFGVDTVLTGGLRVYTTLEPAIQREAELAAKRLLGAATDPEYALVALEHRSGRILAMVGGRDFEKNQFNLAVQGKRQPGSAFKPFVLARAIEEGVRADSVFDATPYTVKVADGTTWRVDNYDNQATSPRMTLQAATNWSVNGVYARLIMQLGPEDVVDICRRMGITSPVEPNPAIALGGLSKGVSPLEMASAFGTIANGGMRVTPVAIALVTDDAGEVVYEPEMKAERALEDWVARETSVMLRGAVESGTGIEAQVPGTWVAGKTGTTQAYRDAWFVGYTSEIATAVWVGHREGQIEMTNVRGIQVTGGSFPAQIWSSFMTSALRQRRASVIPAPVPGTSAASSAGATGGGAAGEEGVPVKMCSDSMLAAAPGCPEPVEVYLDAALVPVAVCEWH